MVCMMFIVHTIARVQHLLKMCSPRAYGAVQKFAEFLLVDAAAFDLVKEIHAERNDILGRYSFKTMAYSNDVSEANIDLYWGVIGLVARAWRDS